MRTRIVALAAGGVVALCAGCGSDTTAPATGSTPPPAPGAGRTLLRGEVVAITGDVVTLTDAGHIDVDFQLTPTTQVGQQQDADITAVTVGTCAFGSGQRLAGEVVAAAEVSIEDHRAGGCRRGGGGAAGRGGLAGGEVTAIDGDTYSVSAGAGLQRFRVSLRTRVVRLVSVPASALTPGQCATATGPRTGAGMVAASRVVISPASVGGCFPSGGGFSGGLASG
ncbi:MAG: hypothetical protein JWL78_840 [Chloroflexi bacterium]|nr:hypothetical protein [Chloroflexota bacterium]MEA2614452.1 hypothetical protein [Chloroflexota bacterium]